MRGNRSTFGRSPDGAGACGEVNECADGPACDVGVCTNTDGGCPAAYHSDAITCTDVNNCLDGSPQCDANRTPGNAVEVYLR